MKDSVRKGTKGPTIVSSENPVLAVMSSASVPKFGLDALTTGLWIVVAWHVFTEVMDLWARTDQLCQ